MNPALQGLLTIVIGVGGCIGYFAADGTMDTCICLRTALISRRAA